MQSCHWKRKLLRWFFNTPHRSSDRAYEASKNLHPDSLFFVQLKSFPLTAKDSSRARSAFGTKASGKSRYVICCSLLEHRISLFLLGIQKYSKIFFCQRNFGRLQSSVADPTPTTQAITQLKIV